MREAKRLILNTGIIAVGGMATKLVQFLLLPLYTSVLSTSEYGTVDYLNTIALFCVPAVSLLMDEALFRFLIDCRTEEDRRKVVTASCALVALGSAFLVTVALLWSLATGETGIWWVVGLVLAGVALQMVGALLRGLGDTAAYALANFLSSALMIALNILFIAVLRWGVPGMLAATVIAQGGVSVVFAVARRVWRFLNPALLNRDYLVQLLHYSVPLIPNKVSWTVMNMSSRLVIMNVMGAAATGVFAVAYKFPNVMDQVYGFFYMSWKESSARALSAGDEESFYNSVYVTLRRFMMGVVLVMTAFVPFAFDVMVDPSYHNGVLYAPILLLATYFSNMSGFYGGIFTAHRDTAIMGTTTVVSAILCLVLNVCFIPALGLYGAALSTLAATFFVNEYRRRRVARYAKLFEDRREAALTLLALGAVFAAFYLNVLVPSLWLEVAGVVTAMTFSVIANWGLVRRVGGALVFKMKGGR